MKRFTFLTAFLLFVTVGVFAQRADTTIVINNHEINIDDNENQINIKIFELKDGVRLTKEPLYESNYFRKCDESYRTKRFSYSFDRNEEVVKEETNKTVVKSTSRWFRRKLEQPLPTLYFSHLEITDGAFGSQANIHQRPASFEWGIYNPVTIFCAKGGHFGMATGVGLSNSYNFFAHDYVLTMENGNAVMKTLSDFTEGKFENSKKSYLRYWSFRVPLTMQLQWKLGRNPLTFSAGAELEWRLGMRSFARYDGSKHLISNDLNYNAIGCNALFQVGYDGWIIFGRVGLTDMFDSKALGNTNQLSVGIGFNFD